MLDRQEGEAMCGNNGQYHCFSAIMFFFKLEIILSDKGMIDFKFYWQDDK